MPRRAVTGPTSLVIACAAFAADAATVADVKAQVAPADVPVQVSRQLDSLASRGFSGVVLLARNGSPVLERAFGFADR